MNNSKTAVQMVGIYKEFPGIIANNCIDFLVNWGEIHGLLGENGSGKTTLMNILSGLYKPDKGEIYLNGNKVSIKSPRDANNLGIGMIRQNFSLINSLNVTENIILGLNQPRIFIHHNKISRDIQSLSEKYGLGLDPYAKVWQLSMGERQRVEIVKQLYRGADILILDEPTAILTPQEVNSFFAIIKRMANDGKCIVFITHKLDEIFRVADNVTVLKDGINKSTVSIKEVTKKELAHLMVGREMQKTVSKKGVESTKARIRVEDICALKDNGLPALKNVSFTVYCSEIFGIAGVAGNGQGELAEVICGLRRSTKGRIFINNIDITTASPLQIINLGVSHVPEDRMGMGLVSQMNIEENLILKGYRKPPLSKGLFIDHVSVTRFSKRLIETFKIQTPSVKTPIGNLSGGNIQRTILAREITAKHEVIIAVHPTSGLDLGATEFVHQQLIEQRNKGVAILLISEDLEELLLLSDRIAVIYEGRIEGIVKPDQSNIDHIGLMMAGEGYPPHSDRLP